LLPPTLELEGKADVSFWFLAMEHRKQFFLVRSSKLLISVSFTLLSK
jgi:hypothetical protein